MADTPAPAAAPVAPAAPAPAPAAVPLSNWVRALDQLGDMVGGALITYLAFHGKVDGLLATAAIVALMTGQTTLRNLGQTALQRALGTTTTGVGLLALLGVSAAQHWHVLTAVGRASGHAGFVDLRDLHRLARRIRVRARYYLLELAGLALAGIVLVGCPLPPPDGCPARAHRCSPAGIPESCSSEGRWSHPAQAQPCSASGGGIVCCVAASPYGGPPLEACAPQSACLATPDVIATDAADAAGGP